MAYLNIALILFLIGCSSHQSKRKLIVPEGEPTWLYSPKDGCSEVELCASGEGNGFNESDINAKKSLASIFETKINARFNFSKHTFTDTELVEMKEFVQSEVDEHVSGILKGSSIKERFKKDGLMFSLARLDKKVVSKLLKDEISRVDNELLHFYKMNNRLFLKKMNVLYNQRNVLNEKFIIVNINGLEAPVSFSQINNIKYKSVGGAKVIIKGLNTIPRYILKKVEEQLSDLGYKVVDKKNDYYLNLTFNKKEEYLNVKGFKKFTFIMNVETKNNIGKKLGDFTITKIENGRNEKDAFLKARSIILEQFEKNLEKLNFK